MDRKGVVVIVVLAVLVVGFLVVRDPVNAAGVVRNGWEALLSLVRTIGSALVTFFQHLAQE
ncbi:hypothetical protein GCM10027174_24550 [Salinifilum aidingensis]